MKNLDLIVWSVSIAFVSSLYLLIVLQWNKDFGIFPSTRINNEIITHLSFKISNQLDNKTATTSHIKPSDKHVREVSQVNNISNIKTPLLEQISNTEKSSPEIHETKPQSKILTNDLLQHVDAAQAASQHNELQIEQYLQKLLMHIEEYKFYPSSARRRGINGEVTISFSVDAHGKVSGLDIISYSDVLKKAAVESVNSALPLPIPPTTFSLPHDVKFTMLYRLN